MAKTKNMRNFKMLNLLKDFNSSQSEVYSEAIQTSKMEFFAKIVNSSCKPLTIFARSSILDIYLANQGTLARWHISKKDTLAREHVSTQDTLAREHVKYAI